MEQKYQIRLNKMKHSTTKKNAFLIGGGGTKGVYAVGVLKYLLENNPDYRLQDSDIFGGTSVGSYFATALSLGFDSTDMLAISKIIDISNIVDSKWLFMVTTYRFLDDGYLYDNNGLQKIIIDILNYKIDTINQHLNLLGSNKLSGQDITFGHLKTLIKKYPTVYKHLLVNTVDISRGTQIFITSLDDKWDNIKLLDALMASSALPFIFKPVEIYYYPKLDYYGYLPMDGCLTCKLIDGGISTNDPTDFFLTNDEQYANYNLWLLIFTSDPQYVKIDGTVSMLKYLIDYLLSGKNNIKMNLIYKEYNISTFNLHSTGGTLELYTQEQIQNIINAIYDQCKEGKLRFDS